MQLLLRTLEIMSARPVVAEHALGRRVTPPASAARLLGLIVLAVSSGCAESVFRLDAHSRLPKWFSVPDGSSRSDVTVSMAVYSYPWGSRATFKLWDNRGHQVAEATGRMEGLGPRELAMPGNASQAAHY